MTHSEYIQYQESVAAFITAEKITHLSTGTRDLLANSPDDTEDTGESWFSWYHCHCCKRPTGGYREYLHARDEDNEIVQYIICEDCVYYVNYGKLDDSTMLEIEESKVQA